MSAFSKPAAAKLCHRFNEDGSLRAERKRRPGVQSPLLYQCHWIPDHHAHGVMSGMTGQGAGFWDLVFFDDLNPELTGTVLSPRSRFNPAMRPLIGRAANPAVKNIAFSRYRIFHY